MLSALLKNRYNPFISLCDSTSTDVLQHLADQRFVARDDRNAAVFAQAAHRTARLADDQLPGADVPHVQRQLPVAVQKTRRHAAEVIGRGAVAADAARAGQDAGEVALWSGLVTLS